MLPLKVFRRFLASENVAPNKCGHEYGKDDGLKERAIFMVCL
jgi:uncharacterized protein (DUF983 family)